MFRTLIENLFYSMYADEPDNAEVTFYWTTLTENLTLFADPKYTKIDIDNHFYGIMSGLCRAQELQGFKRGLSLALKLTAECAAAPDLTKNQARELYEQAYKEEAQFAKTLRAVKGAKHV